MSPTARNLSLISEVGPEMTDSVCHTYLRGSPIKLVIKPGTQGHILLIQTDWWPNSTPCLDMGVPTPSLHDSLKMFSVWSRLAPRDKPARSSATPVFSNPMAAYDSIPNRRECTVSIRLKMGSDFKFEDTSEIVLMYDLWLSFIFGPWWAHSHHISWT